MIDVKSLPPMKLLKRLNHDYPEVWEMAERVFNNDEFKDVWDHELTYLPIDAGIEISLGLGVHKNHTQKIKDGNMISCMAGWRRTKMIYNFDKTLSEELFLQAKDTIDVSLDMLRLPAYSIYLRPNVESDYDGVFAFIDRYKEEARLMFLPIDRKGNPIAPAYLILSPDGTETIEDSINKQKEIFDSKDVRKSEFLIGMTEEEIKRNRESYFSIMKEYISRWVNLILYLSAVNSEIKPDKKHFFRRSRKIKDIPREVELLNVGETIGVKIRTLRARYEQSDPQGGHHRPPVMHVRRAHWHTFLYGKKRKQKRLKWLPPIVVNGDTVDIVTINKVL